MLIVTNAAQFLDFRNEKTKDLIAALIEIQKTLLREEFDSSLTDANARACIDIADTLGFFEMATEMEQDLEIEKLLTV
jgi:hypothetical protein